MNNNINKKSPAFAVFGFVLTWLMVVTLMSGGIIMAVKTTILSGGDINEIFENTNLYGTISDAVTSEITSNTSISGLSSTAVESVFSEEVVQDVAITMTDALRNDTDADLTGVKDKCMDAVVEVSEQAVDNIIDDVTANSDVISIDALKSSDALVQMESDFNVDMTTAISGYVEETYGSATVNIADVDIDKVKADTKETIKEQVVPVIEQQVDELIVEANVTINEEIDKMNEEYNVSGAMDTIEKMLDVIQMLMISCIVLSVVFGLIQIIFIYKGRMNKGFRNVSIAAFISGITLTVIGLAINAVIGVITGTFDLSEPVEKALADFVGSNVGAVGSRSLIIGIVYIMVAVVCVAAAIIIKKKSYKDIVTE